MPEFDFIVVGQGLAGTSLAWCLRQMGARCLVVDDPAEGTASRVSAGLITAITGQKLVMSWRHHEVWPAAREFYRSIERITRTRFFDERPMVRLFNNPVEVVSFQQKRDASHFTCNVSDPVPAVDPSAIAAEFGGFEMDQCGRLQTRPYLQAIRSVFEADGGYRTAAVDISRDVELVPDGVVLRPWGITARRLVFCQGITGAHNPWFADVAFKPAKGELLTLRIPEFHEARTIHRGIWLNRLGDGVYQAGATYDWKHLDGVPTESGRVQILTRLGEFLRRPVKVISHEAAVRPIHRNQLPIAGIHPRHPQLAIFNGLGSKGSLFAPFFAQQLATVLLGRGTLDREIDLTFKSVPVHSSTETPPAHSAAPSLHVKRRGAAPLTQQAQQAVRQRVLLGETVIDATAGNGHDTQFLAESVGPEGMVIAIDVQRVAIQATARRLATADLHHVQLIQGDHGEVLEGLTFDQRRVAAIMFNLGYLPGGDKAVMTNPESSCRAILLAAHLLRPGGLLTVLAYTGHDGGIAETQAVEQTLRQLLFDEFEQQSIESQPGRTAGPKLFLITRRECLA